MKALIHIGMPKAGSSSIQEFLKINREVLSSRGIRYAPFNPDFGSQYELAATGLAGAGKGIRDGTARQVLGLNSAEDEAAYVARYRAFLDAGLAEWREDLFVGSSEHIQPWLARSETIAALDIFLRNRFDAVRYVVYLRPQADTLLSSYSERIRRGETLDFETHLQGRLKALNLNQIVKLWETAVGADRLDARLLVRDALTGGDLIHDFCAALDTPGDGLRAPGRMNTALSREEIALHRRLNRVLPVRRAGGAPNPFHLAALRGLGVFLRRPGTPLTLTNAQKAEIETHFAASNERLRARRFAQRARLF